MFNKRLSSLKFGSSNVLKRSSELVRTLLSGRIHSASYVGTKGATKHPRILKLVNTPERTSGELTSANSIENVGPNEGVKGDGVSRSEVM